MARRTNDIDAFTRLCTGCGYVKFKSEFSTKGEGRLMSYCRDCDRARCRRYYAKNRERLLKNHREYYRRRKQMKEAGATV